MVPGRAIPGPVPVKLRNLGPEKIKKSRTNSEGFLPLVERFRIWVTQNRKDITIFQIHFMLSVETFSREMI